MKRTRLLISGRVQGVCYRAETWRHARRLQLTGWVRNLRDGRVEAVFEGHGEDVETMVSWCKKGPSLATVTDIEIVDEPLSGHTTEFIIRHEGA